MLTIKYDDPATWIGYVENELNRLCETSIKLISIGDWIIKNVKDRDLGELLSDPSILKMLFGGLHKPEDIYNVKTLACWYSSLYGLDLNYREVFNRLELGLTMGEACTGITTSVRTEVFNIFPRRAIIPLLRRILSLFEELAKESIGKKLSIKKWRRIRNETIEDVKAKPEIIVDLMSELLKSIYNISPLRNEKSFFIVSTHTIPYFYMVNAYREIEDKNVLKTLRKVLGLEVLFTPEISSETLRDDYTIFGYSKGSPGYIILRIISEALKVLSMEISETPLTEIFETPDDRLKYLEQALRKLKATQHHHEALKDIIEALEYVGSRLGLDSTIGSLELYTPPTLKAVALEGKLTIKGVTLTVHSNGRYTNINLLKFIDFIAPQLFLGIGRFRRTNRNVYEWQVVIPTE